MSEAKVQKAIAKHIEKVYGGLVVKVITANKRGVPDLLCCIDGTFVAVEVKKDKTKGYKATPLQNRFILDTIQRGGIGFIADCKEDVDYYLAKDIPIYHIVDKICTLLEGRSKEELQTLFITVSSIDGFEYILALYNTFDLDMLPTMSHQDLAKIEAIIHALFPNP